MHEGMLEQEDCTVSQLWGRLQFSMYYYETKDKITITLIFTSPCVRSLLETTCKADNIHMDAIKINVVGLRVQHSGRALA